MIQEFNHDQRDEAIAAYRKARQATFRTTQRKYIVFAPSSQALGHWSEGKSINS